MMINANNNAMRAFNYLNTTNNAIEKTARALSTGLRVATAADDAASFAMGQNISAQIAGIDRAIRNSQDGVSMLQTAEGGLNQINSMLQRMRELSVQAANDTLTTQDRSYIQLEIGELRNNIDSVAHTTTFNGKRLLDGSSAAVWSSDDETTKVTAKGALTAIDSYGQKKNIEGNYRIQVRAKPGQTHVQKTSIMVVKNSDVITNENINESQGIRGVTISNLPAGEYSITAEQGTSSGTAALTGSYNITSAASNSFGDGTNTAMTATPDASKIQNNASVLFEVVAVNDDSVSFNITSNVLKTDGSTESYIRDKITITKNGTDLGKALGISDSDDAFNLAIDQNATAETIKNTFSEGSKFVYNFSGITDSDDADIVISGTNSGEPVRYALNNSGNDSMKYKDIHCRNFIVDQDNGNVSHSDIILSTNDNITKSSITGTIGTFSTEELGKAATLNTKLRDVDAFWNASDVFMLERPQTITITQGDGQTAEVKLYSTDTISDVREKLNNAIAYDLGQAKFTDNPDRFVSFVESGSEDNAGFETVAGTFVIRSAVAGNFGKLTINSNNQEVINALGLNTLQEPADTIFTASVFDAHTNKILAENVLADGNKLNGIISPNMTIEFDYTANTKAAWDEDARNYILTAEANPYETVIHIKDRSTAFQIGQNLGEDIYINIGDMRSEALGLNKIDVSTRKGASQAITLLDRAIHQVGVQRSKIGTYQNELEYNTNSLTQTSLHMQESESRLKDTDMATEYMEFVKLQILSQTGTSMLGQANQNSQSIMNILQM